MTSLVSEIGGWTRTAVHCSEPVARRDVGEVTCGQIAVCFEAVLHPKAVRCITVSEISKTSSLRRYLRRLFLDTTAYTLQEGESHIPGRRRVWRCEGSAFVDRVAEDQRL